MIRALPRLLIALTALSPGCERFGRPAVVGSGVAKTETRSLAEFRRVELTGALELRLTVGQPGPIELTADDNILPLIETTVTDGLLSIHTTQPTNPKTPMILKASAPAIESVDSTGAGVALLEGISGDSLTLDSTGASRITARGSVDRLHATVTGAGALKLAELVAKQVEVDMTGAGDAEVNAVEKLRCSIVGAGSVRYLGDPVVEKSGLGAGTIEKMKP